MQNRRDKIFNGEWIAGAGGDSAVFEPATGTNIGTIGRTNVNDVRHAAEIESRLIRESGSTGPKAGFELHVAANECYEAAATATQPYGQLLRTEQPRLIFARRLPVGVVDVIAPFNVPLILAIRSVAPALALGNAVLLKPDPRTAVSGGVSIVRISVETRRAKIDV